MPPSKELRHRKQTGHAHSEQPLEPHKPCEALGVKIGVIDLDNDDVPSI